MKEKTIKQVIVYPEIDNDKRQNVMEWCAEIFGDRRKTHIDHNQWIWGMRSNYDRSKYASFDMYFKDDRNASIFILRWGGVAKYIYEDSIDNNQLFYTE
jgi:hypothetical protein